jgi:hypothetical protein
MRDSARSMKADDCHYLHVDAMLGGSWRTVFSMPDHAHNSDLDRPQNQSHSHYGITANNTVPLLAFAYKHTTGRDIIEGHLRCIGWRAVRRLQMSMVRSKASRILTSLQPPSRPANQSFGFSSETAPRALHNSIVSMAHNRLPHTSHFNVFAFQMSIPYCLAARVESSWLLSVAEQTSSLFNAPQLGSHEGLRDSCLLPTIVLLTVRWSPAC